MLSARTEEVPEFMKARAKILANAETKKTLPAIREQTPNREATTPGHTAKIPTTYQAPTPMIQDIIIVRKKIVHPAPSSPAPTPKVPSEEADDRILYSDDGNLRGATLEKLFDILCEPTRESTHFFLFFPDPRDTHM
jgi:hypothetical protein